MASRYLRTSRHPPREALRRRLAASGSNGLAKKRPFVEAFFCRSAAAWCRRRIGAAAGAAHGSAVWRHRVKVAGAVHHSIVAVLDLVILKDGLLSLAKLYFHCYLVSGLEYEVTYCECANI